MLFWCITSKVISRCCSTKRRGCWRPARFTIWSQMTRWLYSNFYKEQHSNPPISSYALGWTHQGLLPWLLLGYLHTSRLSPELRLSGCFPPFLSKLLRLFISLPDSPPLMMNERWPEWRADGYWCSTISTPMWTALDIILRYCDDREAEQQWFVKWKHTNPNANINWFTVWMREQKLGSSNDCNGHSESVWIRMLRMQT